MDIKWKYVGGALAVVAASWPFVMSQTLRQVHETAAAGSALIGSAGNRAVPEIQTDRSSSGRASTTLEPSQSMPGQSMPGTTSSAVEHTPTVPDPLEARRMHESGGHRRDASETAGSRSGLPQPPPDYVPDEPQAGDLPHPRITDPRVLELLEPARAD